MQSSDKLTSKTCKACHADSPKVSPEEVNELIGLIPSWNLQLRDNVLMLEREYLFKNYKLAWGFANKVSELAENEFHHPAILLEWGKVKVTWWTHTIGGLHLNDFICAAKTDQLEK